MIGPIIPSVWIKRFFCRLLQTSPSGIYCFLGTLFSKLKENELQLYFCYALHDEIGLDGNVFIFFLDFFSRNCTDSKVFTMLVNCLIIQYPMMKKIFLHCLECPSGYRRDGRVLSGKNYMNQCFLKSTHYFIKVRLMPHQIRSLG